MIATRFGLAASVSLNSMSKPRRVSSRAQRAMNFRIEDDLSGDVRGQRGLIQKCCEQSLLGDRRMPLGMSADSDIGEAVIELMQGDE
jgi:hypothetical protein